MGWRAAFVSVACISVACSGEIREVRPVSSEAMVQCEAPRASAQLAEARLHEPGEDEERMARVNVRADTSVGCDTEALGVVEAPLGEDRDAALAVLRSRAVSLGGDMVLEMTRATDEGVPRLVGTAARCHAMSEVRPFEVLEQIDIAGLRDGTDAAFARLRARAWELHADRVLDVQLHEDEAELTHLTGMAVRYR